MKSNMRNIHETKHIFLRCLLQLCHPGIVTVWVCRCSALYVLVPVLESPWSYGGGGGRGWLVKCCAEIQHSCHTEPFEQDDPDIWTITYQVLQEQKELLMADCSISLHVHACKVNIHLQQTSRVFGIFSQYCCSLVHGTALLSSLTA